MAKKKELTKITSYLEKLVEQFPDDTLTAKWQSFDLLSFSANKKLFDFQKQSLSNALKGLWIFYKECKKMKEELYNKYEANGLDDKFDFDLKKDKRKTSEYLLEYEKDYPVEDDKISFESFINRMSFWMATGSGKTLVIVKLIELLGKLIKEKEIPENDILFLAHREDLLEQFQKHVNEFNNFNFDTKINLKSLREYDNVKRENSLPFANNEITVFYYRSDLLSDEHKEKIVNFRNYDNEGKWYILLDEAHKGDKEDSKRQIYYAILSRNGFIFNFSATFTDPRDFATCVYNFNLSKFIEQGYGKHIYISNQEVTAFRDKDVFSKSEKQKIVLKSLILLTYINQRFDEIRKTEKNLYHKPLLLTLVNSVEADDSDLKLFFDEIEKIARNDFNKELYEKAIEELSQEFETNPYYEFEDVRVNIKIAELKNIKYKDVLEKIFNSKSSGNIEALTLPGNRNEIIFKLATSEKPFALIKIGNITGWIKNKLTSFQISESFDNESMFKKINQDDSEINILMGSRAFYEGWDSNRPNVILFVNIGVEKDSKKFVLQSVGRGIRIEPVKNKRKRLLSLYNSNEVEKNLFQKIEKFILPLESLYVFGTDAENLKQIIKALKDEKKSNELGKEFEVNPEVKNRLLLIPVYKDSNKILAEEKEIQCYPINKSDYESASNLFNYLGEKVTLIKYGCDTKVLEKVKDSFNEKAKNYNFSENRVIEDPELVLQRILDFFSIKNKEFDNFKKLDNEIIHFKRINFFNNDGYDELKTKIEEISKYPDRVSELEKQYGKISRKEFEKKQLQLFSASTFESDNQKIEIKYLENHYYIPLIISEKEKIDYINHIINVPSEVKFIKLLGEYLEKKNNSFDSFDWWMFSKLDHTLDEVYIPYFNPMKNDMDKFRPDFIFWLQKGKDYTIIFVDPKGTQYSSYQHKIDGFEKMFKEKKFKKDELEISVKLLLHTSNINLVGEGYRKYWFDSFEDFGRKIK